MTLSRRRPRLNAGLRLAADLGLPTHVRADAEGRGADPDRDPAYLARVRELPCCARNMPGHRCMGPMQAHHAGRHVAGKTCPDRESIALCSLAHTCLHDFKGCFSDFGKASMRRWEDPWIYATQSQLGVTPTVPLP